MFDSKKKKAQALGKTENWAFGDWRQGPPRSLLNRLLDVGPPADICCGLALFAIFIVSKHFVDGYHGLWVLPFGFLMWGYLRAKGKSNDSIRDLMDFPPTLAQYPVSVQFLSKGAQYGQDKGVVSFVDGMMLFQGFRSSFSLPIERARLSKLQESPKMTRTSSTYNIPWYEDGFYAVARVKPINTLNGVGDSFGARFWMAYSDWDKTVPDTPGKILYPPRTPQVQATERYVLELIDIVLAVSLAIFVAWLLFADWTMLTFAALCFLMLRVGYGFLKMPVRGLASLIRMKRGEGTATEYLEDAPEGTVFQLGEGFARTQQAAEQGQNT